MLLSFLTIRRASSKDQDPQFKSKERAQEDIVKEEEKDRNPATGEKDSPHRNQKKRLSLKYSKSTLPWQNQKLLSIHKDPYNKDFSFSLTMGKSSTCQ